FSRGELDGAWVPEPWGTRLIQEANGKLFLDERSIWPNGDFVVTHLIVRVAYLRDNPDVIEKLVRAHIEITEWINANPAEAKTILNKSIEKITSAALPARVLDAAWENQRIT